ncbi:MAG: trigger factor [Pseudomonadales bacterium]|nr:trigger factor [Pseudomonadales bacterium]
MQVSIETLSDLGRRMTIGVPAEKIESQVQLRLQEAARNFSMKGFRKGKVPVSVIKNRFGRGVRQEVLGEVMSQSYYEAVNQENIRPAGQPRIEAKKLEEGKDLEFVATFEVYPEITLGDFSSIHVEKKLAEISDKDIDNMIETLRKQKQTFQELDAASEEGDQLDIDFIGTMNGEKFEGGEARGSRLVLGSKRMIPGFEEGLLGKRKGEEVKLSLTFPETYHDQDLAGQAVEFAVSINSVARAQLPELNEEFFASFDITEGGEQAFRDEVAANMARELNTARRNNIKNQVLEGLQAIHAITVPVALIESEINALRQQAMQQFGQGSQIDESMLPADMFRKQAEKRVKLGLIMSEIVKQKELKPSAEAVRTLVEEMAESYEDPQEVIKWYYSNKNQLATVESMALEEAAVDVVLASAQVNEVHTSYEEALKPSLKPGENATTSDADADE